MPQSLQDSCFLNPNSDSVKRPTRRLVLKSAAIFAAASLTGVRALAQPAASDSNPPRGFGRRVRLEPIPQNFGDNPMASWASGGTSVMTAGPAPAAVFDSGQTCEVQAISSFTEGPCYFDSPVRADISDGMSGLPMQLAFQLVDQNCNPLPGYQIEVWHCDARGVYSAETSQAQDAGRFNRRFCTGGDEAAMASQWFRGVAVADAEGVVNFRSCFPGWYSSRAVHVHFRIRHENRESIVSQLGFNDFFCREICANHPEYVARGEPDTYFNNDTVFTGEINDSLLFNLKANSDGSLLAFKRLIVNL